MYKEKIALGRNFMKNFKQEWDFVSDQKRQLPQPPLTKAAQEGNDLIPLPREFAGLSLESNILHLFHERKSRRVYTEEDISLPELSFLLWSMQGIKEIRGNNYATLRTVPSGGARHPFEVYMFIRHVEGLEAGAYHYLASHHSLEKLWTAEPEKLADLASEGYLDQKWAGKASVAFFISIQAYRAEWRYGPIAHRVALIDSGHLTQNLYLAAEALQLGTCAIAALDTAFLNEQFGLDGDEEFVFYGAPVGTIRPEDKGEEDAFYTFANKVPGAPIE